MRKNFASILLLIICGVGIVYVVWKYRYSREEKYLKPLSILVEKSFQPLDADVSEKDIGRIRSMMQRSEQRLASGAGGAEVDRLTVGLCEQLLAACQKRQQLKERIRDIQKKNYPSLGEQDPEAIRKLFMESTLKGWDDYAEQNRVSCSAILRAIEKTD